MYIFFTFVNKIHKKFIKSMILINSETINKLK